MMHILLVRFSSMGDVVLATSVVDWLKTRWQQKLKVTLLTSEEFAKLVKETAGIDHVLTYDRKQRPSLFALASLVRTHHGEHPIDIIVDVHASTRSWILRLLLWEIPRLVVDKRRIERKWLTTFPLQLFKSWWRWPFMGMERHVERLPRDWQGILLTPLQEGSAESRTLAPARISLPLELPPKFILLAPGASFVPKKWPINKFIELARMILADTYYDDYHLVISAGPADVECLAFDQLKAELSTDRILNLQGKTNLLQTYTLTSKASLVIGNDSGVGHMAEAYGIPVVAIFGPTHEAFGFAPHLENSQTVALPLWCRPCSTTGARKCWRGTHECMQNIPAHMVKAAMQKALSVQGVN